MQALGQRRLSAEQADGALSPCHLKRIIVHVEHGLSDGNGSTVAASHMDKTPVRMVDDEVELKIFDKVLGRCTRKKSVEGHVGRGVLPVYPQNSISASLVESEGKVLMPYSTIHPPYQLN